MSTCKTLLAALLLLPHGMQAQTVRGLVRERATMTPLSSVVVELVDSAMTVRSRALSTEAGEYHMRAPEAGSYRLRVRRLGFRPELSGPFQLGPDREVVRALDVESQRITLDAIRVDSRANCAHVRNQDDASDSFALWEQVRTALSAMQLSAGMRGLGATIVSYQRSLNPRNGKVLEHHSSIGSGVTTRPWKSARPDALRQDGYVVADEQGWVTYFAPDIDLLISDGFLADHCLRVDPRSDARRVGIAFAPVKERKLPDIEGTIWLQGDTIALQRLEFAYTELERAQREAGAGGEMEFVRARNGAWFIRRWNIRMPIVATRTEKASGVRSRAVFIDTYVKHVQVEGGELAVLTIGKDTLLSRAPYTVIGKLTDSSSGTPLHGAYVALKGTQLRSASDSAGAFRFDHVMPGEYVLDVRTASLDALGAAHSTTLVVADSITKVRVRVPTGESVAASLCGETRGGMLAGRVEVEGDSALVSNARVVAEWSEFDARQTAIVKRRPWRVVQTDVAGRFRLCGLPTNTALEIRVESARGTASRREVLINPNQRLVTLALILDSVAPTMGAVTGVVLSDLDRQPVSDAEVAIQGTELRTWTNDAGAFRLGDVAAGTRSLTIRRIGFQVATVRVTVAAGQTFDGVFALSRVRTLDTVSVEESAIIPSFEENRRLALGKFVTRAELAKQEVRRLSEILSQFSGVLIKQGTGGKAWVYTRRGQRTVVTKCVELEGGGSDCDRCFAQVYLDKMLLNPGLGKGEIVPDINRLPVSSVEAIEYYATPAQTPLEYSRMNSQCGVLVIHTRRTP